MTPETLFATVEATWPPARRFRRGPWTIRDGAGGGKRVSAATAEGWVNAADIALMEAEMAALGQAPLVMIRPGDESLDALLETEEYRIVDPVVAYAADIGPLAVPPPPVSAFTHWPPLAMAEDIWAEGGIGPARIAVMHRAAGPKVAILARTDDTPSGAAFAAVHAGIAMLHAIEVLPRFRRKGAGRNIIAAAACWAAEQGAQTLALVVTERNAAARPLYASLGMKLVGQYHYRLKAPDERPEQ